MGYKKVLGIDFGGSGIKGAIVHTKKGELLTERYRIETPQPSTPEDVSDVIKKIADHFKWDGLIGVGFPSVIQQGEVKTAANIDSGWIGVNANQYIGEKTGLPVYAVNDADAAGVAEMKFGVGAGVKGTVLLVTIGTGLGTVLFSRGKLVANTELGHIILNGTDAEVYASDAARKRENLSWDDWGKRFNEYLHYMEGLFWPELIILGGGASKKDEMYMDHISVDTPVVPARLLNNAGIIGAALAAKEQHKLLSERKGV